MSGDGLRWWQYVGPWPLRAWVVFWGVGAVAFVTGAATRREQLVDRPAAVLVVVLAPAFVFAAVTAATIALGARSYPDRRPRGLVTYLLFVLGATGVGSIASFAAVRLLGVAAPEELVYVPFQALRAWTWSCFLLAVAGVTVLRLGRQTRLAEEALALAHEQQELMLINEERSRRQISLVLHDRVQAGLMAACLELRVASAKGDVAAVDVERIVARIDDIRGLDVRQAARSLSPDLASVDLRSALTELAAGYQPAMTTTVDLDARIARGEVGFGQDVALACYRIVEQGLLNASVHGGAGEVRVSIAAVPDEMVEVCVADDGSGLGTSPPTPGFGSAIINSWCRVQGGAWSLEPGPHGGAVLTATLHLSHL